MVREIAGDVMCYQEQLLLFHVGFALSWWPEPVLLGEVHVVASSREPWHRPPCRSGTVRAQ
jgi:hypothetical protein